MGAPMPWWEYEQESQFSVKPMDDPETDRAGTAGLLIAAGALGFVGFLIFGLFSRSWSLALWGLIASGSLASLGGLLIPKPGKRT